MNWPETRRACPVAGCTERSLYRHWDVEFEIVTCPAHGWQYPVPDVVTHRVPTPLMDAFLDHARRQPKGPGVARELVFTPGRWGRMVDEFMRGYEPLPGDPDFDPESFGGMF